MRTAAAHHLAGVRAAHAAGDRDAASSHGVMYGVLAKTLGFSPTGEPPEDVAAMARDPRQVRVTEFRPHGSDALVLEHLNRQRSLKKAESEEPVGGATQDDAVDMTHLLPQLRRDAGERLLVLQGMAGPPTVHHVRAERGRRVPLSSWTADDRGDPVALTPGAPGDVGRAVGLALRVRAGSGLAKSVDGLRRVAGLFQEVRDLAKAEADERASSVKLKCGECGEFVWRTRKGLVGFHDAQGGKRCAGSGKPVKAKPTVRTDYSG